MASPSSMTALRHTLLRRSRPLHFSTCSIRWASIVPYIITNTSHFTPPPPPLTLEQALEAHQHKQMSSLLEEQIKLEQSQRMRYQSELQLELARHRNAILEKQEKAAAVAAMQRKRGQEQEQELEKELELEVKAGARRRQSQLQLDTTTTSATTATDAAGLSIEVRGARESSSVQDDQETDKKLLESTNTNTTTYKTQAPYTTVAASIIDPRYRTMFGYRGPEHPKSTPADLAQLEQERLTHLTASFESSLDVKSTVTRISAENRVRLAMMDYTPSQIDSMTPEQASAVLHSAQHHHDNARQEHTHEQQLSSSKPTDTDADADANTCIQVGGTNAATSALVQDRPRKDEAIDEEGKEEQALRFSPDVMSSASFKVRGIHN
ncbi:MAG: hypothetical protein J3R72DRAFT_432572 [Linnemannia gamsii]|nr:MAG: hypothetical protein J3R72DRAFT_432572 [Linnemannia gamsii]